MEPDHSALNVPLAPAPPEEPPPPPQATVRHRTRDLKKSASSSPATPPLLHALDGENGWTASREATLKRHSDHASALAELHGECTSIYKWRKLAMHIPSLVISAGTSAVTVLSSVQGGGCPSQWLLLAAGICSIAGGVLQSAQSYSEAAEKSTQHEASEKRYAAVADQVRMQLLLPRAERSHCDTVLTYAQTEMSKLASSSPTVLKHVAVKLRKRAEVEAPDMELPDVCTGLRATTVCVDVAATPQKAADATLFQAGVSMTL